MIEENDERKLLSKKKTFAPVAFGSRVFSPAQLKMSIYCKEFLAIYHAILEYSHILWETTIPTMGFVRQQFSNKILPDKNNTTRTLECCDYVLQFKFRIMHVAGSQNTAANFLSKLELTPKKSTTKAKGRYLNVTNRSQLTTIRRRRRRTTFLPAR